MRKINLRRLIMYRVLSDPKEVYDLHGEEGINWL